MDTIHTSGLINLNLPGHDYRVAKHIYEQTAESIKSKYIWNDGLEIEFIMVAGKIDVTTNGKIYIENDKTYTIRLD